MSERAHILLAMERLPERATPAERIAMAATDVREAMMKVDRRLRDDAAARWDGWVVDEAFAADTDNRFEVNDRMVISRLRLVRP